MRNWLGGGGNEPSHPSVGSLSGTSTNPASFLCPNRGCCFLPYLAFPVCQNLVQTVAMPLSAPPLSSWKEGAEHHMQHMLTNCGCSLTHPSHPLGSWRCVPCCKLGFEVDPSSWQAEAYWFNILVCGNVPKSLPFVCFQGKPPQSLHSTVNAKSIA